MLDHYLSENYKCNTIVNFKSGLLKYKIYITVNKLLHAIDDFYTLFCQFNIICIGELYAPISHTKVF